MSNQLKNKNSFLFHVAKLTSGTVVAQAIAVLTSPVITRLYSPDEMGGLASLTAVVGILGIVAAGRYDLAIVLPEKSDDAVTVASVGVLLALAISFAIAVDFAVFGRWVSPLIGLENVPRVWTLAIAPMVFLVGLEQVLQRLHIRAKKFGAMATTQIVQQTGVAAIKIGFGAIRGGVVGLFFAALSGYLIRSGGLITGVWRSYAIRRNQFSWERIKRLAGRYRRFPIFNSWAGVLNTASTQLPVLLFASLFSPAVAGYYALSHKILMMPMTLIGRNIGKVYYERASKARHSQDELGRITLALYRRLLFAGAVMMSFVTFYGDIVFPFVFGEEWIEAGRYAQWISIWIVFQLAISPLSTVFSIQERNAETLIWQATLFVSRSVPLLLLAVVGDVEPLVVVAVYSLIGAVWYGVFATRNLGIAGVSIASCLHAILISVGPVFLLQGVIKGVLLFRSL